MFQVPGLPGWVKSTIRCEKENTCGLGAFSPLKIMCSFRTVNLEVRWDFNEMNFEQKLWA